jgi:hypothetical protein
MDATAFDPMNRTIREQRGLQLAQSTRIKQIAPGKWLVPSESSSASYLVDTEIESCTCADWEKRLAGNVSEDVEPCKHVLAIKFARHQGAQLNGAGPVGTLKPTYREDWPNYNAYQCNEKDKVRVLLRGLCEGIVNPVQGRGRPRLPLSDVVYAAAMKVFVGLSGRRASTDVKDCLGMGHIDRAPSYNALFDRVGDPALTPILMKLVEESAAPIAEIDLERAYGVDATGFSTKTYVRWFDHKYGRERREARWVKLHIAIGVRSKIITAAVVTDGTMNDSPQLPGLVETTAKQFTVKEVLADKGYVGMPSLEAIAKVGAEAYIPFKSNSQGEGPELWRKLWHLWAFHRDEFLKHYHSRSNVEGVFSSMKRKFGGSLRSRKHEALVNEALLKVICHNLSVLVRMMYEMGIEPTFWGKKLEVIQ